MEPEGSLPQSQVPANPSPSWASSIQSIPIFEKIQKNYLYVLLKISKYVSSRKVPLVVELVRNLVAHGDAREGKWRGNWRMECVASTLTPPPNVVYPALLKLMPAPRLPAVDWTDAPTDLNGLLHFGERRNLVSARVPSRFARAIVMLSHVDRRTETKSWRS